MDKEQKQTHNQALHSDFQPQRFIFASDKIDSLGQSNKPSLFIFCRIFKNEMNRGNEELPKDIYLTLEAIQAELNRITSKDFETPEGFKKFMTYFIVLKQVRSSILSLQDDSISKISLYKSTCTPIKFLFSGNSMHQKKNRNENNDEDEIKFKKIIKRIANNLHYDQKYINGYYAPVLIFNDSDTSYKYKSFWKEYVEELSQKIYLIFIYKAILRFQTSTESKKIKFNINLSENQEDPTNDESQNSDNEKTIEENDNDELQLKESEVENEETHPNSVNANGEIENVVVIVNEANDDIKPKLPSDIEEHEEDKSNKEINKEPEISESHKSTKDNEKEKEKEKVSTKKTPQNSTSTKSNQVQTLPTKTQEVDPDFLDFSPILTETNMALKNNSNKREVSYKIMNLSNDISKKLVEYFENDLVKISKMVNIHEDLFVFEIASCFIEILKIMNALLYESGAEIPPLSFIWKSYDGFKLNFRNNVFTFINNYIIQQNIPYNFSTHSFATKDSMNNLSHLKNYDTYSIFSRFDDIFNCIRDRYQDFGIDAVSSIASLIGKKQMTSIVRELIQQLEIKAQEFCDYYAEFIANFNFKVDLSNESQNFYALKEYFDSFITFFNLSNSKNVITNISKIGNIIALLILFDSAIASEFSAKDMISASIVSVIKAKNNNGVDSPFSMYLSNPDFSYQRHDFFSDAIQTIYKILNNSKVRLNFDEINGHSGFYQFAIPLIYASSHKSIPTSAPKQNQSQNNEEPKNPLINLSDSISIACSIILEVLSQYDLYGYSNVLRAFLLFDENNSDNFDISSDVNSNYNNNPYKLKLNNNLQIIDIFHYTLAKFSFPAPNHIFVFKNLNNVKSSCDNIIELLLHRCNQVAVLFFFPKISPAQINIEKCELAAITNCKQMEVSHKSYISIYSKKEKEGNSYNTTDILKIFINELEMEENLQDDEIDPLISTIRSISHQKYGDFTLLIFQKKRPFSRKIKIDIDFLIRLREHFPYVIKDENYITPKKGRNPMPFKSSMSNFDIKRK